ncbi:hypothetical protein ACOMHN_047793 [Nucella lapillus]
MFGEQRSSSELLETDKAPVPKKTRYVTSSCVMLTYHEKDTSSEVDDHFSRALSSPGSSASSSCGYSTSGGDLRHAGTAESPPMSQRNFPPSFWDAGHQLHHLRHLYTNTAAANYPYPHPYTHHTTTFTPHHAAAAAAAAAGLFASAGATPHHDPSLYPLSSPFLSAMSSSSSSSSSSTSPFHTPFPSSLHKDPWGSSFPSSSSSSLYKDPWGSSSFPFASGGYGCKPPSALNYYRYPSRASATTTGPYSDPHSAFSSSYSSSSEGSSYSSGRFSSSASRYAGSRLLPSVGSSALGRGSGGGCFPLPTATITSAHCAGAGADLASARESTTTPPRGVFAAGSGSLSAGLDSSAHEAGKDFHWY